MMKNHSKIPYATTRESIFSKESQKQTACSDLDCTFSTMTDFTCDTRQDGVCTFGELPLLSTKKPVLVLDLDETLIRAFKKAPKYPSVEVKIPKYNRTVWIVTRPGLEKFLKKMMETYELVVYTTSVMDYAEAVLEGINIKQYFSRVYDRKYCCTVSGAKDLSVVSTDFKKMILIDDSTKHTSHQPDNSIHLPAFLGDLNDRWLKSVALFLDDISGLEDLRPVNKKFTEFMMDNCLYEQYTDEMKKQTREKAPPLKDSVEDDVEEEGLTAVAKAQVTSTTKRMIPCFKKIVPTSSTAFETSV